MSTRSMLRLLDVFKPPEKSGRLKSFAGMTYDSRVSSSRLSCSPASST